MGNGKVLIFVLMVMAVGGRMSLKNSNHFVPKFTTDRKERLLGLGTVPDLRVLGTGLLGLLLPK